MPLHLDQTKRRHPKGIKQGENFSSEERFKQGAQAALHYSAIKTKKKELRKHKVGGEIYKRVKERRDRKVSKHLSTLVAKTQREKKDLRGAGEGRPLKSLEKIAAQSVYPARSRRHRNPICSKREPPDPSPNNANSLGSETGTRGEGGDSNAVFGGEKKPGNRKDATGRTQTKGLPTTREVAFT